MFQRFYCLLISSLMFFIFNSNNGFSAEPSLNLSGDCKMLLFSNDGEKLFALKDNWLVVYDAKTGNQIKFFDSYQTMPLIFSFNQDADVFLFIDLYEYAESVTIVNYEGQKLGAFAKPKSDTAVFLNREGDAALKISIYGVEEYNYTDKISNRLLKFPNGFLGFCYSKYADFYGGYSNDTLYIYDVQADTLISENYFPHARPSSFQFSPDASRISYITDDNYIKVVRLSNGTVEYTALFENYFEHIKHIVISPDNKYLAYNTTNDNGTNFGLKVIEINTGNITLSIGDSVEFNNDIFFINIAFSPDSKLVTVCKKNDKISLWDLTENKETLAIHAIYFPEERISYKNWVNFSADQQKAICSNNGNVYTWDLKTGQLENFFYGNNPARDNFYNNCLNYNGKYFLNTRFKNRNILKWDLIAKKIVLVSKKFDNEIIETIASPAEDKMLVAVRDKNLIKTCRLIDLETLEEIPSFGIDKPYLDTAMFTRDGSKIVILDYNRINVYSTATGETISQIQLDSSMLYPTLHPDGNVMMFQYNGDIVQMDLMTGQFLRRTQKYHMSDVKYSSDGKKIIVSYYLDKCIRVHDSATMNTVFTIPYLLTNRFEVCEFDKDIIFTDLSSYKYTISLETGKIIDLINMEADLLRLPDNKIVFNRSEHLNTDIKIMDYHKNTIKYSYLNNKTNSFHLVSSINNESKVALTDDNNIYILDMEQSRLTDTLVSGTALIKYITQLTYNDKSKLLIGTKKRYDEDWGDIFLWNLNTNKKANVKINSGTEGHYEFNSAAFDETGWILNLCNPNILLKYDLKNSKTLLTKSDYNRNFRLIRKNPALHELGILSTKSILILDENTFEIIDSIGLKDKVISFEWSPNGEKIAVIYSKTIEIIDAKTKIFDFMIVPSIFSQDPMNNELTRRFLKFNSTGTELIVNTFNSFCRIDLQNRKIIGYVNHESYNTDFDLIDDSTAVGTSQSGIVNFYNLNKSYNYDNINGPGPAVMAISSDSDNPYIATNESQVTRMDFFNHEGIMEHQVNSFLLDENFILINQKDNKFIANHGIISNNPFCCIYDIATGTIENYYPKILIKSINKDGNLAAGFSMDSIGQKYVFTMNLNTGNILWKIKEMNPTNITLSEKGSMTAYISADGMMKVIDSKSGNEIGSKTFKYPNIEFIRFVPNSGMLAVINHADGNFIKFYNPLTFQCVDSIRFLFFARNIVFGNDGKSCIINGDIKTVLTFNIDFSKYGDVEAGINKVDEKNMSSEIEVYPNPANDLCKVIIPNELGTVTEISVTDLLGRIVFSMPESGLVNKENREFSINMDKFSKGVYYIIVNTNVTGTCKMIIKL